MKEVQNPEKFIKDLIPTYTNKINELDKLIGKLGREKKEGLWWDSKVPEKDKVKVKLQLKLSALLKWNIFTIPFKNISYSELKKCTVVNAVTALYVLYDKIGGLTQKIDKIMLEEGINVAEPEINRLIFKLKKKIEKAKRDKEETQSSTVYNLNKELIAAQSQVVSNLQSITWEASQKRNLTAANQLAQGTDLNQECKQLCNESETHNEKLEEENQELRKENQALREENQALEEKNQVLEEENQVLKEIHQELEEKYQVLEEENQAFEEGNQAFEEENQVLKEIHQELEEKYQVLEEENQAFEEKNQALKEMHQKLTQKFEIIEKKSCNNYEKCDYRGCEGCKRKQSNFSLNIKSTEYYGGASALPCLKIYVERKILMSQSS